MHSYILGCLSPTDMWISEQVGYYTFSFCLGIGVASILVALSQKQPTWAAISALIVSFHPVWTVGVQGGDCGQSKRFYSGIACLGLLAVLICQLVFPAVPKSRLLLILCLAAWLGFLCDRIFLPILAPYILFSVDNILGQIAHTFITSLSTLLFPAIALTAAYLACVGLASLGRNSRREQPKSA